MPPISYLNNKDLDLFPFSGVSNSKTIYQNENGYYMIYDSDRFGFNNPDYEWDNKEVDSILIKILGPELAKRKIIPSNAGVCSMRLPSM